MKFKEAVQKVNDHGIYQLNKGESLADVLDHIDNGTARKGYRVKADNGRLLSENEVIMHENKAAFHRSFTPAVFVEDEVEDIDDIPSSLDYREDRTERGVIINCYYCGICIRIDIDWSDGEDYGEPQETIHCDGCMKDAISRLAM